MRRQLVHFALAHPVMVLDSCCAQLERFDNMIPLYADAFRYLTPLALDALAFVLLQRLTADGRKVMQDDGVNLAKWYQNLAQLVGAVFCKYSGTFARACVCGDRNAGVGMRGSGCERGNNGHPTMARYFAIFVHFHHTHSEIFSMSSIRRYFLYHVCKKTCLSSPRAFFL
jgi:hypothetical protein